MPRVSLSEAAVPTSCQPPRTCSGSTVAGLMAPSICTKTHTTQVTPGSLGRKRARPSTPVSERRPTSPASLREGHGQPRLVSGSPPHLMRSRWRTSSDMEMRPGAQHLWRLFATGSSLRTACESNKDVQRPGTLPPDPGNKNIWGCSRPTHMCVSRNPRGDAGSNPRLGNHGP